MMSWSKMMQRLLLITICFALCRAEGPAAMLPAIFQPTVMYTSPNSAVIKWEELRRKQEKDGYTIEYGKNWQTAKTVQVSKSSYIAMIPDLEPDTLYNIRVRGPGTTRPGPSVTFRTKPVASARIGVPQGITLVPLPLYKLLVTWDLPYRARASDVVHYSLVFAPLYSPYLRKTSLLLPGHYKSFTLTYLRPNTLYKVKIAALLKSRKGPYSSWVIAQTVGQVWRENPTQAKIPLSKSTSSRLRTGTPSTILTTPSTRSTVKRIGGLQLTTKQALTEENVLTTSYQTEQSSARTIMETTQEGETTTLQTTEASVGHVDPREHSTLGTSQPTEKTTAKQDTEGTTLAVTVGPSEHERIESTTQATEKKTTGQDTEGTTPLPVTVRSSEQERFESTTQATEEKTKGQDTEGTTILPVTVQPLEQERDETTQQTSQETTELRTPQQTTPSQQRTTSYTTDTTSTPPPPSQHTEQVTEATHPTRLTTRTTKELTTQQITLNTTTTPSTKTTEHKKQSTVTTTATPPTRKTTKHTQPATTTTHETTEQGKLSTEQATETQPTQQTTQDMTQQLTTTTTHETTEQGKLSTEQATETQPTQQTTRDMTQQPATTTTHETTEQEKLSTEQATETQPTQQTTQDMTQQPATTTTHETTEETTSDHLRTNTAPSGTVDLIPPSTDVVTGHRVADDSQLFPSSPSPTQPGIIITPSSSTVPSLVITGPWTTNPPQDTCEVLKPSMCSDIGYQTTKMTSKAKRQSDMMDLVQSMWTHLTPLCQSHAKLKQFLCAASFPYCSRDLGGPFLPCRSMCMATRKSCNMNSEDWPAEVDCSNFPDVGESAICISYGHENTPSTTTTQGIQSTPVKPTSVPATESQTTSTLATKSALATSHPTIAEPRTPPNHCELLYLKACDGIGYKYVQFPNFFNHSHQNDAGVKISKYWPLIEVKCSPSFRLFLCSLYTPICTSTASRNVLPCRSLCQQVTSDCIDLMELYGFVWPEGVKCQDFPDAPDGACLNQKYLTNLHQGNEIAVPTFPTTLDKAEDTSQYQGPSTKAPLATASVNPEVTTAESSLYSTAKSISISKESEKPTLATQPKTESILQTTDKGYVEEPTEAITQRNEEVFTSSVAPMTGTSANEETEHLVSTKSNSIPISRTPLATTSPPPGCEGLYLKMCQGVGYDLIQFPNFFNHTHQNDAGRHMYRFWPLVETNCSPKLRVFLCSLYAPMCTKTVSSDRRITGGLMNNVLPCRSLCHQVKRDCGTLMKLYGLKWPQGVECQGFPMDGEETCMYGKTNDVLSKGLLKVAKAKQTPTIQSSPGPIKCQPLPAGHPCKNHYQMASLPNTSATFENTKTFIEDQTSKIKDMASNKCLRNLEMFLCSVHTPRCLGNGTIFGPCRSQCKTTLRRCAALLEKINIHVTDLKGCRQFPLTQCTGSKRKSKPKEKSVESL